MDREVEVELRSREPVVGLEEWPVKISNWMAFSPPAIRLYGHPRLLAAAQAINGPDHRRGRSSHSLLCHFLPL